MEEIKVVFRYEIGQEVLVRGFNRAIVLQRRMTESDSGTSLSYVVRVSMIQHLMEISEFEIDDVQSDYEKEGTVIPSVRTSNPHAYHSFVGRGNNCEKCGGLQRDPRHP